MGEAWAPAVEDVARHIPTRTRDLSTPGSDRLLGTFTATTTPTKDQAQAVIDSAVAAVIGAVGALPSTGQQVELITAQARSAAEWRAAADIQLAYPLRDGDVAVYDQLNARAGAALDTLRTALATETEGPVALLPVWQAPDLAAWADNPLY
jgi:hypothetical protein